MQLGLIGQLPAVLAGPSSIAMQTWPAAFHTKSWLIELYILHASSLIPSSHTPARLLRKSLNDVCSMEGQVTYKIIISVDGRNLVINLVVTHFVQSS